MLPENIYLSENSEEQRRQITNFYRDIASEINGYYSEFIPTLYGSTTAGTLTYTSAVGFYHRQNLMVDLFLDINFSALGGAVGDISIDLPFKSKQLSTTPWMAPIYQSGLSFSANYTSAFLVLEQNSTTATIFETGSGQTAQALTFAVSGTGSLKCNIRYIGQV